MLVLLTALGWALARIAHTLESITVNLQNIAMGVRAIERETAPLASEVSKLNASFVALDGGFDSVAATLTKLAR